MRILGGTCKNREIKVPKCARPTSAKLRQTIFDILKNQIDEASFLDLFAGSGAMGIEALSRGAKNATFIEKNKIATSYIRENLQKLKLNEAAEVFCIDASKALKILQKKEKTFDLIYIDPPYDLNISSLIPLLSPVLAKDGLIILEQRKDTQIDSFPLREVDKRKFGDTLLYFFCEGASC